MPSPSGTTHQPSAVARGILLAASSLLLWLLVPSPALRGTLAAVPLAVASFSAIEWLARGRQGKGDRGLGPLLVCAPVLLVAGGLLAPMTGILLAEQLFATGFFLYLIARLYQLLPSLRRLLGSRLPSKPSLVFFLLPAAFALLLAPWHLSHHQPDGDEPWYLLLTHSLAYDLDVDLANNYQQADWQHFLEREISPQVGDPIGPEGELYSRHNRWFPLLLALPYRVGGRTLATVTLALLAAAIPWLLLRVLYLIAPDRPRGALFAWLALSFAPPLLAYSHQLWVEAPAALFLLLALERLLSASDGKNQVTTLAMIASCLAFLVLLKLRFLLVVLPLAALTLVKLWQSSATAKGQDASQGQLAKILGLVGLGVLFLGTVLSANLVKYGNPFKMLDPWASVRTLGEIPVLLTRILGLFWDVGFGLFWAAPIWLLALAGVPILWRLHRSLLAAGLLIAAPSVLAIGARSEWYGGWSPPFRYGMVLLPLIAIAFAFATENLPRTARARVIVHLLGVSTLCLALLSWLTPGLTYNLADGHSHLTRGFERLTGAQIALLVPSAARPNLALLAWTLGSILLLFVVYWGSKTQSRGGLWRSALALSILSALLLVGWKLPSAAVEFESSAVTKTGGDREPAIWLHDRTRFEESWVLPEGTSASATIRSGGERVVFHLRARSIQNHSAPIHLELTRMGRAPGEEDQVLERVEIFPPEAWQTVSMGPFLWPPTHSRVRLRVLAASAERTGGVPNGVSVDRMNLEWLPATE